MRALVCAVWVSLLASCHHADIAPTHPTLDAPLTCDRVTIYGGPGCDACHHAEKHLRRRGVAQIILRDVTDDPEAERFVRSRSDGHMAIPVIEICGAVQYGYSPDALDRAITRSP